MLNERNYLIKNIGDYALTTEQLSRLIAVRIQNERETYLLTVKQFSKILGVSKKKLLRWESGEYNFKISEITEINNLLNFYKEK